MTELHRPDLSPDHPLNKIDPNALRTTGKFEAKLSFHERCSVLALHRQGVSISALAAAFGVNRRTVVHIATPTSKRYRSVRDEEMRIGPQEFVLKYADEAAVMRINDAAAKQEVDMTGQEYRASTQAERAGVASKRASTSAGITYYKPDGADFTHRIDVKWFEADTLTDQNGTYEHPAGWFWRDMDGGFDEFYNGDVDEGTHMTSTKALAAAKASIG